MLLDDIDSAGLEVVEGVVGVQDCSHQCLFGPSKQCCPGQPLVILVEVHDMAKTKSCSSFNSLMKLLSG